jgi:hypothetical protein
MNFVIFHYKQCTEFVVLRDAVQALAAAAEQLGLTALAARIRPLLLG